MTSNPARPPGWAPAPLLSLLLAIGCGSGEEEPPLLTLHGPHGGHTALMSAGAGFEIELALDDKRRRMMIYVLEPGGAEPHPLPVESLSGRFETDGQSLDATFAADPRPDDPEGEASRFALPLDQLPQQLLLSDRFVLKLEYVVDGKSVTASIPHRNDHAHEYHHD